MAVIGRLGMGTVPISGCRSRSSGLGHKTVFRTPVLGTKGGKMIAPADNWLRQGNKNAEIQLFKKHKSRS